MSFCGGRVAELVDARDSKSRSGFGVRVQFPPRPPQVDIMKATITTVAKRPQCVYFLYMHTNANLVRNRRNLPPRPPTKKQSPNSGMQDTALIVGARGILAHPAFTSKVEQPTSRFVDGVALAASSRLGNIALPFVVEIDSQE